MPQRGKWELGSWPACLHVFSRKLDRWVKIGAISLYEFRAQWEEWLQHGCATQIGTSFIWKITTISQKEEGEIPSKSLKGQKLNIYFTFHLLTIGLLNEEIWEICLPLLGRVFFWLFISVCSPFPHIFLLVHVLYGETADVSILKLKTTIIQKLGKLMNFSWFLTPLIGSTVYTELVQIYTTMISSATDLTSGRCIFRGFESRKQIKKSSFA